MAGAGEVLVAGVGEVLVAGVGALVAITLSNMVKQI